MNAFLFAMQPVAGPAAPAATATPGATTATTGVATPAAHPTGLQAIFGESPWMMILPMVVVWYFLIIRPQSKQRKDEDTMRNSLKRGDEVVTTGGIIGKISGMTDSVITLELQEKVRVRVLRTHVVGKPPSATQPAGAPVADSK